jgi:hypothetical protein
MRGRTGSTVFVRNYGRYHRLRHAGKWCPRSAIGAPAANLQQKLSLRLKCPVRPDGGFDGPSGSFPIAVALALSLVGFGEIPSAIGTSFVQPRSVAGSAVGRKLAIRMWQFLDHDYRNRVPFSPCQSALWVLKLMDGGRIVIAAQPYAVLFLGECSKTDRRSAASSPFRRKLAEPSEVARAVLSNPRPPQTPRLAS